MYSFYKLVIIVLFKILISEAAAGGPFGGLNIGELLSNPNIMNMVWFTFTDNIVLFMCWLMQAASMMQNPAVQSTWVYLMNGNVYTNGFVSGHHYYVKWLHVTTIHVVIAVDVSSYLMPV